MTPEQLRTALVEKLGLTTRGQQDALIAMAESIRLQERQRIIGILKEGSCYSFEKGTLTLLECRIAHPEAKWEDFEFVKLKPAVWEKANTEESEQAT